MKLPQPKIVQSGPRIIIKPWNVFHKGKKMPVDGTEIEFSAEDAGHWIYVQLVYFKDTEDCGYHVSSGAHGTGPVLSKDTSSIEFLATLCSGTVNQSGTGFLDFNVARVQSDLLEGPDVG